MQSAIVNIINAGSMVLKTRISFGRTSGVYARDFPLEFLAPLYGQKSKNQKGPCVLFVKYLNNYAL